MSKRTMWIVAACAIAIAASGAQFATAATVAEGASPTTAVHHLFDLAVLDESPGRPAVLLDTDEAVPHESFTLDGPARLVLDLPGVISHLDQHSFTVGDAGVIRVRAGQYQSEPHPVTRVVFDLERPVGYRISSSEDGLSVDFGGEAPATWGDGEPVAVAVASPAPAATPEPEPAVVPAPIEMAAVIEPQPEPAPVAMTTTGPMPEPEVLSLGDPVPPVDAAPEPPSTEPDPVAATASLAGSAVSEETIEHLLAGAPELASTTSIAPAQTSPPPAPAKDAFATKTIVTEETVYTGKRISLNLVDADIKQLFRLFHDISGLNFVLDPTVEGRVTIVLDHVPWDQALDIVLKNNGLDKVLEKNVIRIAPTQKLAAEAAQRKALKEAKELEVEPITITRTLSYAKATEVERVIRDGGVLSPRGRVIVDERTNTLIISDIPKKVDPLDTLLGTLDTETPQVMIEARIVETSKQFVRDLGVDWGFAAIADASRGTATGLPLLNNTSVRYGLNLPGEGQASQLAFKFGNIIDSFTLDLALNTLEQDGTGRILSSPKIATQNNERAEIEQGVRIPVVNTTATEINVEFVSASLRLDVMPQITAEGTIILDITVENNSPDFQNTVGDVPPIQTQRAQTKVLIADGGTTVIGGIFTVNEGYSEAGVPWFRKLPGLGWLFKTTSTRTENRELLIFITPNIMKIG